MKSKQDFEIKAENMMDDNSIATVTEELTNQTYLGVTDEVLNAYYHAAWLFIKEHKWPAATDAFKFLTFLTPYVHEFWMCLGVAEQSQSQFEEALVAYLMAMATKPEDPMPYANAFQCEFALGNQQQAMIYLHKAEECCGNQSEHKELKSKLKQLANV